MERISCKDTCYLADDQRVVGRLDRDIHKAEGTEIERGIDPVGAPVGNKPVAETNDPLTANGITVAF